MKYFINICLATIMMVSALNGQTITVAIPNTTGNIGDTIVVPVTVDQDLSGLNVYAMQFHIAYNSNAITCIGIDKSGSIFENIGNVVFQQGVGTIKINGIAASEIQGSGSLLKLKFILHKAGNASLQFKNDTVNNFFNEGKPRISLQNGYINVPQPPTIRINPSNGELLVGESLKFTASGGTAPYTWSLSDPAMADIDADGLLTAKTRGTVDVLVKDNTGYSSEIKGILIRSFSLHIRDTAYYQNNFIDIPVLLKNLDETNALSGEFTITYNKSILTFEDLLMDHSILGAAGSVQFNGVDGKVSFSFALSEGVKQSGELVRLRFKIADKTSGSTYFDLEEGYINEKINLKTYLGRFSITRLPTLSISPTSTTLLSGETKQFTVGGGFEPYQWAVSNDKVASIDQNGLLTTLEGGIVQIIVKDQLGAELTSGAIDVFDTWLSVRDTTADVHNYQLSLPLDIGSISGTRDVVATSGIISYQSNAIDSITLTTAASLSSNWMAASKSKTNETKISMAGTNALSSNGGVLVNMHVFFNQNLKPGASIHFDLKDIYLNEGNPRSTSRRGTLKIGTVTAINKIGAHEKSLFVFPNPAHDFITLKSTQPNIRFVNYKVLNLSGKTILQGELSDGNSSTIQLESISRGIYLLMVTRSSGEIETLKLSLH